MRKLAVIPHQTTIFLSYGSESHLSVVNFLKRSLQIMLNWRRWNIVGKLAHLPSHRDFIFLGQVVAPSNQHLMGWLVGSQPVGHDAKPRVGTPVHV